MGGCHTIHYVAIRNLCVVVLTTHATFHATLHYVSLHYINLSLRSALFSCHCFHYEKLCAQYLTIRYATLYA